MSDIIFEFKRDGKDCGFLACKEEDFIFKLPTGSFAMISLDKLKNKLRVMVKDKRARIVRAGTTEAVVVPKEFFYSLFI